MPEKKSCFVVMGFGEKVDFESGRKLNLDATYKYLIKPAVVEAGLECVRADEIAHSGVIDVPMYKQLLLADVVVADVSTANNNAFYELGVRHALRPYATVIICEDKFTFPFDIKRNNILTYKHLGADIGASEVERFKALLKQRIADILAKDEPEDDSPLYTYLQTLRRFKLPEDLDAHRAGPLMRGAELAVEDAPPPDQTHSALMEEIAGAKGRGDFGTARTLLATVRRRMQGRRPDKPEDPYILQQLAFATYKSEQPTPQAALEEARNILLPLDPATSNDTETLGLWGAVHKRLWDISGDRAHLDEAVLGYERGFRLRNDYYNGINLAFLHNISAAACYRRARAAATPEEAVAELAESISCFVLAMRVRREVLKICETLLGDERLSGDHKYWVRATMAEAYLGVHDEARAEQKLQEALAAAPAQWMKDSTRKQIDALRPLLADSPLKHIRPDGL
ncbi:MAG: tetratricopeptide repeat-containing protein [Pyrinomonadaceae bacterium]